MTCIVTFWATQLKHLEPDVPTPQIIWLVSTEPLIEFTNWNNFLYPFGTEIDGTDIQVHWLAVSDLVAVASLTTI